MKKVFCLILAVLLLVSLLACGKEDTTTNPTCSEEETTPSVTVKEDSKPNEPSAPAVDMEYADGFEWWGQKSVKLPKMQEMTWETVAITGEVNRIVATTPFNVNAEDVWLKLQNNSFLNESYNPATYSYAEDTRFYEEGYPYFYVKETIDAGAKGGSGSMNVTFTTNCEDYSNISGISMYFWNPDGFSNVENIQENVYGVVNDVYGDYADILVYGKDSDNKRYDGGSWYAQSFSEVVEFGEYAYCFERHIDNIGKKIEFNVWVWNRTNFNLGNMYGIPKDSVYSQFPVGYNDFIPEDFGSTNPFEGRTFGSKWLSQCKDYEYSNVSSISSSITKHYSGAVEYKSGVSFNYVSGGEGVLGSSYSFYVKEEAGSLTDAKIGLSIEGFPRNGSNEETFNALKDFASVLLKDTDLSELVFVKDQKDIFVRVPVNVLGFTSTNKIHVRVDDEFKFIMQMRFT